MSNRHQHHPHHLLHPPPHPPPVQNLPHWTRVGFLQRPGAPRPSPPPPAATKPKPPSPAARGGDAEVVVAEEAGGGERPSPPGDRAREAAAADPRVASLQRNLAFLQRQQQETLRHLHAEIDTLKRENKDLQYKLIMDPPTLNRTTPTHPGQRGVRPPTQGGEGGRGLYQEQPLQTTPCSPQDRHPQHHHTASIADRSKTLRVGLGTGPAVRAGLITSLQPLRIHSNPVHPPRAPTLPECEVIIRQLYNANSLQSQEILRIKAVLRDIVFNKKISAENYILSRAFLADGPRKTSATQRLPQLPPKQLPKKTPRPAPAGVVLPALRQSLGTSMAERQKRNQAVTAAAAAQRSRLKRAVQ